MNQEIEQKEIKQQRIYYNSYFFQICEVCSTSSRNNNQDEQNLNLLDKNNCMMSYKNNQIFIISRGGTKFSLPLDQEITKIFLLPEGLLIQFYVKPEIKLQEILHLDSRKMEVQNHQKNNGNYCYATLTRHPLNPFNLLAEFKQQQINTWYKVYQRIIWSCVQLPFLISYNQQLFRHAFHIILGNTIEVKKQYNFAFLLEHSYSLKNICDNPYHQLLTQTIFQQNHQGQPFNSIVINRSLKKAKIILYARLSSTINVYQIDLYGTNNSTKQINTISHSNCEMKGCEMYSPYMFEPQNISLPHKSLLNEILTQQIQQLSNCVALIEQEKISYYHNGYLVGTTKSQLCKIALIMDPFDSLVLKTLQIAVQNERIFIQIISKYFLGNKVLLQVLQQEIISNRNEDKGEIFNILHILYQQLKLYELIGEERQKLANIMGHLAFNLSKKEYLDYYLRQGAQLNLNQSIVNQNITHIQIQQIYDIFTVINKMLIRTQSYKQLLTSSIKSYCTYCLYHRSKFVLNFYQLLIYGEQFMQIETYPLNMQVNCKYQHNKQYFYKHRYPLLSQKVFHLQYFQSLYDKQLLNTNNIRNKQQKAFIYLIMNNLNHKEILTYPLAIRSSFYWLLRQMRRNLPFQLYEIIPKLGFNLIHRQDLYKNILLYKNKKIIVPFHLKKPSFDDHIKTLVHTSTSQEYFLTSNASQMNKINNDLIFQEVDQLLSSTSEIKIKIKDIQSIPEQRWQVQSQNILLKFANRKLAVIIGQGAFNLATSRSFITDIIKIPKINLGGIMPNDIKIALDLKQDKQSIIFWPEFHSGMTAGLKLSRHVIPLSQDHLKTWIFYQKPQTPKRDYSGFLLSLGLLGYLKCFSPTDIYQYLRPNNQFTSVAILLGVSASNISKSDEALSKALILHIPVLLPPSIDVEIPINVQSSALIGIGLLHKGTCNRTMTEMTLSQIGKRPSSDKCLDRQGYSLAAGWALGMICLSMKDKKQTFRDLKLQERLLRFIQGGRTIQPPKSMISTNYINEGKCSSIKEGSNVNLHITAPAALLAISLMYLKSNDYELCMKITIPNSFNTIEQCNPNHVLLKTVAKHLIMWDNIGKDWEYVQNQVPTLIKFIYENSLNKVYQRYYLVYNVSEIDYQTITTIYAAVMTGTVIAMAFKYAGTGNPSVVRAIKSHIEHLKNIKIIKCQFANDSLNKNCIDQYELFSLLSCSVLGLAIVMAGSCNMECLKIVRSIRRKFQDLKVFHYGFSMAINMAIGFIFLGYGNYTFNRQDMSIAALLISIYPQYPNSPSDNRWHLQALRHFYVLAMEQKILHAVDVDTNKVVNVGMQMDFLIDGEITTETLNTPVLLQQSKQLLRLQVVDEDYFGVNFTFQKQNNNQYEQPKVIYIKRKHFKDINPKLLQLDNPISTNRIRKNIKQALEQQIRYQFINWHERNASINDNPQKLSQKLSYLLPNNTKNHKLVLEKVHKSQSNSSISELYFRLLRDDRVEMLQIYLSLSKKFTQFLNKITNSHQVLSNNLVLSNVAMLINFEKWQKCSQFSTIIASDMNIAKKRLISSALLSSHKIRDYFLNPHELCQQIANNPTNKSLTEIQQFMLLMKVFQIPMSKDLIIMENAIKKMGQYSIQGIQMFMYLSYPECDFDLLECLSKLYCKSS